MEENNINIFPILQQDLIKNLKSEAEIESLKKEEINKILNEECSIAKDKMNPLTLIQEILKERKRVDSLLFETIQNLVQENTEKINNEVKHNIKQVMGGPNGEALGYN